MQKTALEIIDRYKLLDTLSVFGETHLVGNVALNTTVKPDIDIQIYCDLHHWQENAKKIIEIFSKAGLNNYIQRDLKESGKHLVSFSILENNNRWTIDVTQTEPSEDYLKDAYTFYLKYKDRMGNDKAKTVKSLKSYFLKRNMLHNSMSYYIYRAVLDENVKTTKELFDYLAKNKINIGRFKK